MESKTRRMSSLRTHISSACLFMLLPLIGTAAQINTVTITKDTLDGLSNCVHYKYVGLCFWLVCGWHGCRIETSPKVQHYLPDLVDTVYPKYKSDPWFSVNSTIDLADHTAGNVAYRALNGMSMKSGFIDSANSHDADLKFRNVDVIGNPALLSLDWGAFLHSQATPMLPYYQSELDGDSWRSGLLEQLYPQTWIPAKDVVGSFLTNDWGSVYPREGFILQPNVAKASAVIATRGVNIATTDSYDHLSVDLDKKPCPDRDCQTAPSVTGNSARSEWQMIFPDSTSVCHAKIAYKSMPSWAKGQKDSQPFVWIVWREYTGCLPLGSSTYLGSVEA